MKKTRDPKREKDLETILLLAAACFMGYLAFHARFFLPVALLLLLIGGTSRKAASILSDRWLEFSAILGRFNAKLVLRIIYYAFLTPTAFLYRLVRKGEPAPFRDTSRKSYFVVREHVFSGKDLEKMW